MKFSLKGGMPIIVEGNPNRYVPWVNIHDLAEAYVKIVEAPGGLVSGQIFNAAAENLVERDVCIALGRAAGAKGT